MILSFGDAATEDLYRGRKTARLRSYPQDILPISRRKLDMVDAAVLLDDLKAPPGNRLEKLRGDLGDFHSIRINSQWRVVFKWNEGRVEEVKISKHYSP